MNDQPSTKSFVIDVMRRYLHRMAGQQATTRSLRAHLRALLASER